MGFIIIDYLYQFTACFFFFFLNDAPPTEISPLPLPAALPTSGRRRVLVLDHRLAADADARHGTVLAPDRAPAEPALGAGAPLSHGGGAIGGEYSPMTRDRKSTRLNSSHSQISYAVFCLQNKNS